MLHEGFIYDGHFLRSGRVLIGKYPPSDKRDVHGREEIWSDPILAWGRFVSLLGVTRHRDDTSHFAVVDQPFACKCDAADTGLTPNSFRNFRVLVLYLHVGLAEHRLEAGRVLREDRTEPGGIVHVMPRFDRLRRPESSGGGKPHSAELKDAVLLEPLDLAGRGGSDRHAGTVLSGGDRAPVRPRRSARSGRCRP